MEVIRRAARYEGRHCQGGRLDACTGQAALRRRGDWAARGRYAFPHSSCAGKTETYFTGGVADYDYIFADDEREANPTSFKFLQMAHAWAANRKAGETTGTAGSGGGDGGALSRFTVEREQHTDKDSRPGPDGGESMDEDVASVASSQGDS